MKSILCFLLLSFHCVSETLYITGELESKNTQKILMPLVPSFNGKVSEMEQEGKHVKKGDLLVRIDGTNISKQLETQIDDLENYIATAKRSEIENQIQLNTKQNIFDTAEINLEIAQMQAETPLDFIGELKFKQNQLQLKNREKAHKKSINDLKEQKKVIISSREKVKLGIAQKQKKLKYLETTLEDFSIYAKQDGYIIYASQPWTGEKIQEGDQVQTGFVIMHVSQKNNLQIEASINAIDIPKLAINQKATIKFDAFLDQSYQGKIVEISSGGTDKKIWGDALYYQATIQLNGETSNKLLLGMSAQVTINLEEKL